nr:isoprenoid biosynthesis glyoxalase ElbB [uncultured Holophaga sp.]
MSHSPRVAVVLAGSGHMDGAEIREAVFALLALDQQGVEVQCFAPDAPQHHVVNHATGQEATGSRNVLEEASRIARKGNCLPLADARVEDFDALVLPGGFGVAKNLCDFAFQGAAGKVIPDLEALVNGFFNAGKPVGAICIAPALVGLCLASAGRKGRLTLGDGAQVQAAMEALGHTYVPVPSPREVVIDEENRLVTTAAYMFDDARLSDVWTGIERCVTEVLRRR